MMYVGADISYSSPSVTISDGRKFLCLFVSDNKKHENFDETVLNFRFKNIIGDDIGKFDKIETNSEQRFHKMSFTNETFISYIEKLTKDQEIKCVIEECVYGAGSQGESKLYENSSIFKYLFLKKFGLKFEEGNNKTLRKLFSGNGNATKFEGYACMQNEFQDIPFLDILKNGARSKGKINSPIEDIIDSLAFCLIAMDYKFKQNTITRDIVNLLYQK